MLSGADDSGREPGASAAAQHTDRGLGAVLGGKGVEGLRDGADLSEQGNLISP